MFSPKIITNNQSVSLGLQSLGLRLFLLWFSLTFLVLGTSIALITYSISDQRMTQTMKLVTQEALTLRDLIHLPTRPES
ncbi:MAG: hypothetical protein R3194_06740, partial [Limnobacter sp.]|nr:hypothetical protein [Limnobacter sp.]